MGETPFLRALVRVAVRSRPPPPACVVLADRFELFRGELQLQRGEVLAQVVE
jgi:hypothetical protein